MADDPADEISKKVGYFPFAMVVTAMFFSGSVFVLFNIPLIASSLGRTSFPDMIHLINNGVVLYWKNTAQNFSNITSITFFIVLSFISGVIITPTERLFASTTSLAIRIVSSPFKFAKSTSYFSASEMLSKDYETLVGWLMTHPSEKSHWEWELFNYYIYWSIATNAAIFSLIALFRIGTASIFADAIVLLVANGIFTGYALLHSAMMAKVHNRYKEYCLLKEPKRLASPESSAEITHGQINPVISEVGSAQPSVVQNTTRPRRKAK